MAKIEITIPGERLVEEFTALVTQTTSPTTAEPVNVGLVEISQQQPTNLIPGPVGPQGARGSRWYTGDGAPTVTGALLGDMYLDDATGDIWVWDGTAWTNTGTEIEGPTGPTGATGAAGPPNALAIGTVTTVTPGGAATSTITGAPPSQTLNLGIPSGLQGVQGIQGVKGDPGVAGSAGAQGPAGPGVPAGGTTGQSLTKSSATDYATIWSTIVGGATIADSFPGSPIHGQLHWESDTGILYLFYNDGNSSQWVQVGGIAAGGAIKRTIITTVGTPAFSYTVNCRFAEIEVQGGGGAGGISNTTIAGEAAASGGGGAGGYVKKLITVGTGRVPVLTVGAAGGTSIYSDGIDTLTAGAGGAGDVGTKSTGTTHNVGGASGTASGGDINRQGDAGDVGQGFGTTSLAISNAAAGQSGRGAGSQFGIGGGPRIASGSTSAQASAGLAGAGYGSGGGGALCRNVGTSQLGGVGTQGIIIITEYL